MKLAAIAPSPWSSCLPGPQASYAATHTRHGTPQEGCSKQNGWVKSGNSNDSISKLTFAVTYLAFFSESASAVDSCGGNRCELMINI